MSVPLADYVAFAIEVPSVYAALAGEFRDPSLLLWAAGGLAASGAAWAAGGTSYMAALCAGLAALELIEWWRRRRRDRARKTLGEKSRALRDALVRRMPRWSPRLQPEGSPA